MSWVCDTCGEPHEGQPTDLGFTLPDDVFAIPEDERKRPARFDSDFCTFEKRHFIRCVLAMPFAGKKATSRTARGQRSIVQSSLAISTSLFWVVSPNRKPGHGTIANHFKSYPEAYGSPVSILFGPKGKRPMLPPLRRSQSCFSMRQTA